MTDSADNAVLRRALLGGELLFRQLADLMPHLVWTATAEGVCDFLSHRWIEFTGVPLAAQLGEGWTQQLHPDDLPHAAEVWRHAVQTGTDLQVDFRVRRADGEYRWFNTRAVAVLDDDGVIVKWLGTNTDVHDTYLARAALQANEERLRYVTLATHDAIYDWDMRAGMTYRSDTFQSLFGVTAITRSSERWWEKRIHPADHERVIASATAAFRARLPIWNEEYRLQRASGGYANVADRAYLLYDANNKPARMIGAIADITERKQVEQSLHDAQARLLSAMQAAGLATWIWDLATDEFQWDDDAYRLWGRTRAEMGVISSSHIIDTMHPDDQLAVRTMRNEFQQQGHDQAAEFRIVLPDGTVRWIMAKGQYENGADGRPVRMVGVYLDITERKRADETRLSSQKMEALGTLAGGIAHDFNNILLAITGNARLALDDVEAGRIDAHTMRTSLREIGKASERATDLVRRILTFSRQDEAQREVLHLQPVIEEALRLLRPTLPAHIEIRTQYAVDAPPANVDTSQVHQVLMNLVTNAAHAIGSASGQIDIRLDKRHIESTSELPLQATSSDGSVCITVRDTGVGIAPDVIGKIFEPFFTTKKTGQGTGLGLAVVDGIIKSHGGSIKVDSQVNIGTTLTVCFPAAPMDQVQPILSLPIPPQPGVGEHVLYVDDEESLVFLIARVLGRLGYRVTCFVDPVQALAAIQQQPHNFDVLVTDLAMRGMNGFELTHAARVIRSDLPVVLTSGYLRSEDRETAQQLGIDELLLKPNTVDELGAALHRILKDLHRKTEQC